MYVLTNFDVMNSSLVSKWLISVMVALLTSQFQTRVTLTGHFKWRHDNVFACSSMKGFTLKSWKWCTFHVEPLVAAVFVNKSDTRDIKKLDCIDNKWLPAENCQVQGGTWTESHKTLEVNTVITLHFLTCAGKTTGDTHDADVSKKFPLGSRGSQHLRWTHSHYWRLTKHLQQTFFFS